MPDMTFYQVTEFRNGWNVNRLMTRDEVAQFDSFFANQEEAAKYQSEGFTRAKVGDFSRFEAVEPMMKGYLGAKKCYDLVDRFGTDLSNPKLQEEIRGRLMEADLRAGFAFGGKNPNDPFSRFMKECERFANREMMLQTLQEPDASAKLNLMQHLQQENQADVKQKMDETLNKDLEQRVEMAKMLFMNHLGNFQTKDENKQAVNHDENMAEVYAHGGRTMFILPAGGDQSAMMNSVQGKNKDVSGLKNRYFATHGVEPRTFKGDGSIASEAKELKLSKPQSFSFTKHRGMNVSVGGLGNVGPNGKMIASDGTNGHMYMHAVGGDKKTSTMLLVGFENSGPGEKGRMGSTHDASAKKAGGSAFLSDKSYLGAERGGRIVDLSGLSAEKLTSLLESFEDGYRSAAKAAQAGDTSLLDACNNLLTGKQMSVGQMKGMLNELNVPQEQIGSVEAARMGNPKSPDAKPVADEKPVPMELAPNPKKPLRITQIPGLEMPQPPKFMKEPNIWRKIAHVLSFFSKNSYVSKYQQYQKTLPERMEAYERDMRQYNSKLESLEKGGNPDNLKQAYDRTVRMAKEQFGATLETRVAAPKVSNEPKSASPQMVTRLENTLVNHLAQMMVPKGATEHVMENVKNNLRDRVRETQGFQKMIRNSDEHISNIMSNPTKMNLVVTDVTNSIMENSGYTEKQNVNRAPEKTNVMEKEQPQSAPMAMGGLG